MTSPLRPLWPTQQGPPQTAAARRLSQRAARSREAPSRRATCAIPRGRRRWSRAGCGRPLAGRDGIRPPTPCRSATRGGSCLGARATHHLRRRHRCRLVRWRRRRLIGSSTRPRRAPCQHEGPYRSGRARRAPATCHQGRSGELGQGAWYQGRYGGREEHTLCLPKRARHTERYSPSVNVSRRAIRRASNARDADASSEGGAFLHDCTKHRSYHSIDHEYILSTAASCGRHATRSIVLRVSVTRVWPLLA